MRGCLRGKRKRTTRRDRNAVPAPGLVGRKFAAAAPDRLWLADITYVETDALGFPYLAFVLDAHSGRVVGRSMADHLRTELAIDALEMAIWRRKTRSRADPPHRPRLAGRIQSVEATPRILEVWNGTTEGLEFDDDWPGTDAFAGTSGHQPRCSAVVLGRGR